MAWDRIRTTQFDRKCNQQSLCCSVKIYQIHEGLYTQVSVNPQEKQGKKQSNYVTSNIIKLYKIMQNMFLSTLLYSGIPWIALFFVVESGFVSYKKYERLAASTCSEEFYLTIVWIQVLFYRTI